MNRDDIIRMAIKCQLVTTGNCDGLYMDALGQFAALVAAAEREACARVCMYMYSLPDLANAWDCAAAIRARGET